MHITNGYILLLGIEICNRVLEEGWYWCLWMFCMVILGQFWMGFKDTQTSSA